MDKRHPANLEAEELIFKRKKTLFLKDIKKQFELLSGTEGSHRRYLELKPGDTITRTFLSNCLQVDKKGELFLLLSSGWKVRIKKTKDNISANFESENACKVQFEFYNKDKYTLYTFNFGSQHLILLLLPDGGLMVTLLYSYGVRYFSLFSFLFFKTPLMRFTTDRPDNILGEEFPPSEDDWKYLVNTPITLDLGKELLTLMEREQKKQFLDRISSIRKHLLLDTGILIPTVRLRDNLGLRNREFLLCIKDNPVASGEVYVKRLLAIGPENSLKHLKGMKVLDPTYDMSGVWILYSEREKAEKFGCMVFDPISVIATLLTEVLKRYSFEFLGLQETEDILNRVLKDNTVVIKELKKNFSVLEINKILKNLLSEDISIRDLLTICETIIEFATVTKDRDSLSEYVRQALKEAICQCHTTFDGILYVSLLDPDFEDILLLNLKNKNGKNIISLEENILKKLFFLLKEERERFQNRGLKTIILCSPRIRLYFRRLIENNFPAVIVLSFNEIASGIIVKPVSVITMKEKFDRNRFSDREYFMELD